MSEKKSLDYSYTIRLLSQEEGGGYFIEYPDLPGCVSDGETMEEAIHNGQDAISCWMAAAKMANRKIPAVKTHHDVRHLLAKGHRDRAIISKFSSLIPRLKYSLPK